MQALARTTTRDVELHGVRIPAAARCCCTTAPPTATAPLRPDADELDIHRSPSQILTFGQGGHHCLGNAAARMQVRVALEELLARVPRFSVDADNVTWAPGPYVRRPLTVPFEVDGMKAPHEVAPLPRSAPPMHDSAGTPKTRWLADDRSRLGTERIIDAAGTCSPSTARTR